MGRPTVKPTKATKQKRGRPTKSGTNKKVKKTLAFFLKSVNFLPLSLTKVRKFFIDWFKLVFFLNFY